MKKLDVLVIDDDENIRHLYADALSIAGLSVLTAENGEGGSKLALEHHPEVILIDILMPDMKGHKVIEKIRLDSWGKHAKVIYLTNLTEPENVVKAFEFKPEEYIVKSHTEIQEVVNQVRIAMHKE